MESLEDQVPGMKENKEIPTKNAVKLPHSQHTHTYKDCLAYSQ